MTIGRDRARRLARRIEAWFEPSARAFPWRPTDGSARDPYVSLVSEVMLQQTQAARVAERLPLFIARFPDARALASAEEGEVLSAWEGLGYYRRARMLHGAARAMVERHGGEVPRDVEALRALPGVGRYTAGAVASMAFGRREACVDGNITRVILRLQGAALEPGDGACERFVWDAAGALVEACDDPAALNEGLMELGATVCKPPPHSPSCGECPLSRMCVARRQGRQDEIPRPKARAPVRELHHSCVVVRDRRGGVRVQQRGATGLWAGMWEPITLETESPAGESEARRWARVRSLEVIERFEHKTTHRLVRCVVWCGEGAGRGTPGRWASAEEVARLAMSNAARRALRAAGVGVA